MLILISEWRWFSIKRKVLFSILIFIMALSVVSCAKEENSEEDIDNEARGGAEIPIERNEDEDDEDIIKKPDMPEEISEIDDNVGDYVNDKVLNHIKEISSFKTPLLDKSDSRINNIKLASKKIDNYILEPGDEFSFNDVVGERTEKKGYEEAPIIIVKPEGPKSSDALGGGICQLSSTLFNAAKKAGLKITERHPHAKKVPYVNEGEDATIDFYSYDLKFVNTKKNPVKINVSVNEDDLEIKIME